MTNYEALGWAALPMCIGFYAILIILSAVRFGYPWRGLRRLFTGKNKEVITGGESYTATVVFTAISCFLSLGYSWAFLTAFRTTIQGISNFGHPIDCSEVDPTNSSISVFEESPIPFFRVVGIIQITPLKIITNVKNGTDLNTCKEYFNANISSTDFNNIFTVSLLPLFNFCGTDLWETYSGAGVLNPNFAVIIGGPLGAFGMFKGGLKKLFPRHVRNMEWTMMDIAGSRRRFLSYKLWTRHYTHIDPTRKFEANYFRKDAPPGKDSTRMQWRWVGKRTLEGFTERPHGEYMHGTNDDLMHLGPNETIVTDASVDEFNAMLIRNGISSFVRSAIAINITVIPILVVRELQQRQTIVDDTSYLVMQLWMAMALGYSAASALAGWFAFKISSRSAGDAEVEVIVTYNQTGAERYRMGTYYCKGDAYFQNGFHRWPFQLFSFVQGLTSVLLSAVSALTLSSLSNSIIWLITHQEWNRGLQTSLWLPSVLVIFYRFLVVLPTTRMVDSQPFVSTFKQFCRIPFYNWLARLPQLSGQHVLTRVVYEALEIDPSVQRFLGAQFLAPLRLSWISGKTVIVKTTLHGGYYQHFPTKMLLEPTRDGKPTRTRITLPRLCLADGSLLETLITSLSKSVGPFDRNGKAQSIPFTPFIHRIDVNATYVLCLVGRNLRAIRIPGEPWVSDINTLAALYVHLRADQPAPKTPEEKAHRTSAPPENICVAISMPEQWKTDDWWQPCLTNHQETEFRGQNTGSDDSPQPSYALLYRQHPSKPYALVSERRSGEVVARRLPGRVFNVNTKFVCILHALNCDACVAEDKGRMTELISYLKKPKTPFQMFPILLDSKPSQAMELRLVNGGRQHMDSKDISELWENLREEHVYQCGGLELIEVLPKTFVERVSRFFSGTYRCVRAWNRFSAIQSMDCNRQVANVDTA